MGNFAASWTGDIPSPGSFQGGSNIASIVINNDRPTRSEITSITVTFDGPVDATVDDFQLTNTTTNEIVSGLVLDVNGQVATLTFSPGTSVTGNLDDVMAATLSDGVYELKFERSGEFANVAAEDTDDFFRKYGDNSGDDNAVGLGDFAAFRATFGREYDSIDLDNGFNSSLDANRDGEIGLSDFASFRASFGS